MSDRESWLYRYPSWLAFLCLLGICALIVVVWSLVWFLILGPVGYLLPLVDVSGVASIIVGMSALDWWKRRRDAGGRA